MKKITRFSYFIFTIAICLSITVFASSSSKNLIDEADILTEFDEEWLIDHIEEVSEKYNFDVVILTLNDLGGKTATEFADDYYDYNGYRDDGILLLISMAERDWAVSTKGYGITAFTDAGIDHIMENILPDLSEGNYYHAFSCFVDHCDDYVKSANNGTIYDVENLPKGDFPFFQNVIIALVVGFIIAFIATAVMKGQLKSVRAVYNAASYIKSGSFSITESRDLFLYSTIAKTPRQQSNSSGKGGSSRHFSSSGSSHGGRSGKF